MNEQRNIVVIGAALGGISAIAKLAKSWPQGLQASVLVALATPQQPAAMVLQILKSYAAIDVDFAVQAEQVRLGKIYLSPQGKHMSVSAGGVLRLENGVPSDANTPSVNRLFSSAAKVYGDRVIGIVLSGNSKEGAKGLRDIEDAGGIGIVQDPEDAVEPLMPRHALRSDHPNFCVKSGEIASLVQTLMQDAWRTPH